MTPLGKPGVKCPEYLHNTEGVLRDWLSEVSTRRTDSADDADRTFATFKSGHPASPLVEVSKPGTKVSGVAFFTGHLFKTAGKLSHGLCPSGSRVCSHHDVVSHVSVVLTSGDASVNGSFSCGHRHVRRVSVDDGSLHQRPVGSRVHQFGELVKQVSHLVATLTAAHVNHDVNVRPLRQSLLHNGLSGSESTGNGCSSALCQGEKAVNYPLSSPQRDGWSLL